jgi:hypothetical protein
MMNPEDQLQPFAEDSDLHADPTFVQQVHRLHLLTVYSRWLVVAVLWGTLGTVSLWNLRHEFELWADYFTWAAVRYAIAFNRWPSIGIATCIGMTVAVLVWQSRNILFGLPDDDQEKLKEQVMAIRRQGSSHPLWNWMNR